MPTTSIKSCIFFTDIIMKISNINWANTKLITDMIHGLNNRELMHHPDFSVMFFCDQDFFFYCALIAPGRELHEYWLLTKCGLSEVNWQNFFLGFVTSHWHNYGHIWDIQVIIGGGRPQSDVWLEGKTTETPQISWKTSAHESSDLDRDLHTCSAGPRCCKSLTLIVKPWASQHCPQLIISKQEQIIKNYIFER